MSSSSQICLHPGYLMRVFIWLHAAIMSRSRIILTTFLSFIVYDGFNETCDACWAAEMKGVFPAHYVYVYIICKYINVGIGARCSNGNEVFKFFFFILFTTVVTDVDYPSHCFHPHTVSKASSRSIPSDSNFLNQLWRFNMKAFCMPSWASTSSTHSSS